MDDRVEVNRLRWDEMARLHASTYLDPDGRASDGALAPFELDELGDLRGQRVCHLQCHVGGDSISLARLGATVVGADFSEVALGIARQRAAAAGVSDQVSFVRTTVDGAPAALEVGFDGVYTSWGVLCWLPDLAGWAEVVRHLLRPGGWLHVTDTHPYAASLRWAGPGYGGGAAHFDEHQGDYTDPDACFTHPQSWEWRHGLGEIVSALAGAGLRVDWLHEHAISAWPLDDHVVRRADGWWEQPGSGLPLSFSARACRPPT